MASPSPFIEPAYTGTTVYFDEDTFMFASTDQDYTTGFQFTFGGRFAREINAFTTPLRALDWLTGVKHAHDSVCPDHPDGTCPSHDTYQAHTLLTGLTYLHAEKG